MPVAVLIAHSQLRDIMSQHFGTTNAQRIDAKSHVRTPPLPRAAALAAAAAAGHLHDAAAAQAQQSHLVVRNSRREALRIKQRQS